MGFLAYILPVDGGGGRPDNTLPGSQPGIDNTLPGGRPPGIWGGPPLYPDQGLPGSQPGIDNTLPGVPARPDQGLPGGGATPTPHGAGVVPPPKPTTVDPNKGVWVLVSAHGKVFWAWGQASTGAPDNTLPGSQPGVDNTLPGGAPPQAGQLPGQTPQPKK